MHNKTVATSLVVQLLATETQKLPASTGSALHGWLLQLVKQKSSLAATNWHNNQTAKPFSLSPLFGRFAKTSNGYLVVKNQPYWFKIGLLGEDAFNLVANPLFVLQANQAEISLSGLTLKINDIKLNGHQWAAAFALADLFNHSQVNSQQLVMQFKTPTTFRRLDFNYVLPEPKLIFGSLLNKWQLINNTPLPLDLEKLNQLLKITYLNIKTQFFSLKEQNLIGFTGKVIYEPTKFATKENVAALQSLAKLAICAGVGQKTTMGMGVCRLVN